MRFTLHFTSPFSSAFFPYFLSFSLAEYICLINRSNAFTCPFSPHVAFFPSFSFFFISIIYIFDQSYQCFNVSSFPSRLFVTSCYLLNDVYSYPFYEVETTKLSEAYTYTLTAFLIHLIHFPT